MANLVTQTAALATIPTNSTVATDAIGGVNYQRVKIAQGDTGTAVDISSAAALFVAVTTSTAMGGSRSVIPTTQWTVTTTPSSVVNVTTTPSTQMTVTTTPSSVINVTTTPSSVANVTTTPSSQMTVSVTPTSALPIGLITSTSTLISQFISVVPTTQWTVTSTPSSQATVSVTPTSQFTVTTTPSTQITASVAPTTQWTVTTTPSTTLVVTTTPSSQITASVTPTSAITVIQSTATNFPLNVAQDWNTVYGSSGNVKYAPTFVYGTLATSGSSALLTLVASGVAVGPLLLSAVVNAPTAATVSLCGVTAGTATTLARFAVATNGSFVMPYNDKGWLQPASASALAMVLSSATTAAVNINISYIASTL